MRLEPRVRAGVYAVTAVLFVTGATWWILDRLDFLAVGSAWRPTGSYLLMAHGGAAMLAMILLGSLIPLHVRTAWPSRSNRGTGVLMIASHAALIVTAFGLYYIGHDTLRHWTGTVHTAIGFALPVLITLHVLLGRRRRVDHRAPVDAHHERARVRTPSQRPAGSRPLARSGGRIRH